MLRGVIEALRVGAHSRSPSDAILGDYMAARKKAARKAKRRAVRRNKKRAGRPKGVASRLGLGSMSLEELTQVIDAARAEARRKLVAFEESIG